MVQTFWRQSAEKLASENQGTLTAGCSAGLVVAVSVPEGREGATADRPVHRALQGLNLKPQSDAAGQIALVPRGEGGLQNPLGAWRWARRRTLEKEETEGEGLYFLSWSPAGFLLS